MRKLLAAVALTAMTTSPAFAGVVFSDNFDSENGGASALNYTGYANFNSTGVGTTDLVADGDFSINCSGSCVDIDGSPGPGELTSISSFAVNAGDIVRLTFDIGGNQRNTSSDSFSADFTFLSDTMLTDGGFNFFGSDFIADASTTVLAGNRYGFTSNVLGTDPFSSRSIFFTAASAGSFEFNFSSDSADNVGPLLDNVSLDITAVPEPATWAMMIFGFGLVGGALRRGRKTATAKPAFA